MQDPNIELIEISLEEAQKLVDLRDKLIKLHSNPEFKEIVLDGYFKEEAARLALIYSDPQAEKIRHDVHNGIIGVGMLYQHFRAIMQIGDAKEREIAEHREYLDQLRAEAGDA